MKNKERVSLKREKASQNQVLLKKYHQNEKHLRSPPCKCIPEHS